MNADNAVKASNGMEIYENGIAEYLDQYIAERKIDMHREPQSRWNAALLYINKLLFKPKTSIYHKSPHKARKTYGTILLDNNIDNNMVIQQMGHTDISCTEKYYHRNRKNVNKKAEIISKIPEFHKEYANT